MVKTTKKVRRKKKKPSEDVTTGVTIKKGTLILLYGPPGVGKTSLTAHLPRVAYLRDPDEEGISIRVDMGSVPTPEFVWPDKKVAYGDDDFQGVIRALKMVDRSLCDYLVVEQLKGIQNIAFRYHANEHYGGDFSKTGFFAFNQGPQNAATSTWIEFQRAVSDVIKRGVTVIITAHSEIKDNVDPDGPDFKEHRPACHKEIWAQLKLWVHAISFFNFADHYEEDESGNVFSKKKIDNVYDRVLYNTRAPTAFARHWYDKKFPDRISVGNDEEAGGKVLHQHIHRVVKLMNRPK